MKRLLPFIILILLVLAGLLAVPFLLRPESHRQEITDTLSSLLKRPVVIGPLSMGYFPPTLHAEQVAVMSNNNVPILQASSVAAPLDWISLFHLKFAAQEVELSHWRLDIQRKTDGSWDIDDWLPQTSGLSTVKASALREVRWKEGEIHWSDRFATTPQELVLASVTGHWDPRPETLDVQGTFSGSIAAGESLSFTAKGQFFSSPQWAGDLQLSEQGNSVTFHTTKTGEATDLKGMATRWRLDSALALLKFYGRASTASGDSSSPLTLDSWQFHATSQNGKLTFDHSAGISGGLSEAKGSIEKGPQGPILHAELAAKDVPASAISNLAGVKIPLDGKVTMITKGFTAVLSSGTANTVAGEGSIEFKDGSYVLPDSSVKRLAKAKTMGYIKEKFPEFAQKGIPIAKASAHWKAKNGIASVDDGFLASTDIKAGWVGKIDIAKEGLDGYLRLQFSEKDPKKRHLLPAKYLTQPAYGRLQGTLQEWSLRAVPGSKIPSSTVSKLQKATGR